MRVESPMLTWRDTRDEMPEPGRLVLVVVHCIGHDGRTQYRRIRARWVERFTEDAPRDDPYEYSAVTDEFYPPEGWYETNDYEDTNWEVMNPVLAWMPMPALPEWLQDE